MDAVTFQSEVLKIERLLYHVAYTALGNRQECADAVQEALEKIYPAPALVKELAAK